MADRDKFVVWDTTSTKTMTEGKRYKLLATNVVGPKDTLFNVVKDNLGKEVSHLASSFRASSRDVRSGTSKRKKPTVKL